METEFQRLINDLNAKISEGQKYQQRANALTTEGVKLVSNASKAIQELGLQVKDSPEIVELFNLNRTLTERVFSIGEYAEIGERGGIKKQITAT